MISYASNRTHESLATLGRQLMKNTEVERKLAWQVCIPASQIRGSQTNCNLYKPNFEQQSNINRPFARSHHRMFDGEARHFLKPCCNRSRFRERIKETVWSSTAHSHAATHQTGSTIYNSGLPSELHSIASGLYSQYRRKTIYQLSALLFLSLLLLLPADASTFNSSSVEYRKGAEISSFDKLVQDKSVKVLAGLVGPEQEVANIRLSRAFENDDISNDVLVQTKQGLFRGVELSGNFGESKFSRQDTKGDTIIDPQVIGFLGIRYASAPVRRLRFMPPTAYNYAPNQAHNMNKFGPICKQRFPVDLSSIAHVIENLEISGDLLDRMVRLNSIKNQTSQSATNYRNQEASTNSDTSFRLQLTLIKMLLPKESFSQLRPTLEKLTKMEQSEDCLNLNIYTPRSAIVSVNGLASSSKGRPHEPLLPVLVVIHGYSFDYGAGSTIDGARLVRRHQNLLVVTFNFRLNILGFPPKLAGASRGNLGLMDQVAALHWVRNNIASFGGSPSNITLMGTKKGAIFVSLLMLSPLAKGLFQRSVMEDGSALTPLVANHITGPSQQLLLNPNPPAIQHVRLLARLCDCPLLFASRSSSSSPANSSSPAGSRPIAGSGGSQLQQQQQLSSFAEEAKLNALTFECLRHKPVEQLLQPIPLNLLHLNHLSGQIDLTERANRALAATTTQDFVAINGTLDSHQVGKLVTLALREQLINSKTSGRTKTNDLFDAIYGPSTASIRLPFEPVVDGTIVPDEDLAAAMLKPSSSFAHRDLLIGLRRPSAGAPLAVVPPDDEQLHSPVSQDAPSSADHHHLAISDHLAAERITGHMQRHGLSSDQALELISAFVRSFYRYHSQEITNSIISNYLINANSKRFKKVKKITTNQMPGEATIQLDDLDDSVNKVSEQQLQTLESILELIQDTLTSVPLLKTALIHATKQLDPLLDVFVGQQFEKWKQRHQHDLPNRPLPPETGQEPALDQRQLFESFTSFAQSLFSDPQWPLELHSAHNNSVIQPKATYLFQIDENIMLRDVQRQLNSLNSNIQPGWTRIRDVLRALLVRLQGSDYRNQLGFGCALDMPTMDEVDETDLVGHFNRRLCEKFGLVLANFVATGNVNGFTETSQQTINITSAVLGYETKCLNRQTGDSDAVQASDTPPSELNSECHQELSSLALDYLLNSGSKSLNRWPVFDLFSQQVATMPIVGESLWHLSRISDETSQYDGERMLLGRSSFWSNFIPALNCTKTLPILPVTSTSDSVALNSSALLTLNLVFNCHQQGAKTPLDSIQMLTGQIGRQLKGMISRWSSIELGKTNNSQQNHHNLRMANMNQSELEQHQQAELSEEEQQPQQQQQQQYGLVSPPNDSQPFSRLNPKIPAQTSSPSDTVQVRRIGLVIVICSLVLSFTVASGACVMMWHRKNPQRNSKRGSISNHPNRLSLQQQSLSQTESSPEQASSSPNDHEVELVQQEQQHPHQHQTQFVHEKQITTPILLVDSQAEYHTSDDLQAPIRRSSSNHICAIDHYQPPKEFQNIAENYNMGKQKPSSYSLNNIIRNQPSLANQTFIATETGNGGENELAHQLMHQQEQLITSESMDEPIMIPIVNTPLDQIQSSILNSRQKLSHRPSCLVNPTNGANYGGSSSEMQSATLSSSSKKRVKISDPLGTSRRNAASSGSANLRLESYNVQLETGGTQQSNNNQLGYCLIHGREMSHSSSTDLEPTGYYTLENGYINANNVQLWPGDEDPNAFVQQPFINHCDHGIQQPGTYLVTNSSSQLHKEDSYRHLATTQPVTYTQNNLHNHRRL